MTARDEVIEIPNGLSEQVRGILRRTGIKGLNLDNAEELGAIDRISYMLCLMHACISAGYRVYGQVDYMLETLHGKRHEISRACNQFEKDYKRFMDFWRQNYQTADVIQDMNRETEDLYHQVMRWALLPEKWELGEPIHTTDDTDVIIKVETDDSELKFKRSMVESEVIGEPEESWCVTRLTMATKDQKTVYEDMDKSSAQMSAKRLSADDPENIYTATILQTFTEKRTDALPMKAYQAGEVVGNIGKEFKQ